MHPAGNPASRWRPARPGCQSGDKRITHCRTVLYNKNLAGRTQFLQQFLLVIIHMLAQMGPTRHDDGFLAGPQRRDDRARTPMQDHYRGARHLPLEVLHLEERYAFARRDLERRVAVLDDDWSRQERKIVPHRL